MIHISVASVLECLFSSKQICKWRCTAYRKQKITQFFCKCKQNIPPNLYISTFNLCRCYVTPTLFVWISLFNLRSISIFFCMFSLYRLFSSSWRCLSLKKSSLHKVIVILQLPYIVYTYSKFSKLVSNTLICNNQSCSPLTGLKQNIIKHKTF